MFVPSIAKGRVLAIGRAEVEVGWAESKPWENGRVAAERTAPGNR